MRLNDSFFRKDLVLPTILQRLYFANLVYEFIKKMHKNKAKFMVKDCRSITIVTFSIINIQFANFFASFSHLYFLFSLHVSYFSLCPTYYCELYNSLCVVHKFRNVYLSFFFVIVVACAVTSVTAGVGILLEVCQSK